MNHKRVMKRVRKADRKARRDHEKMVSRLSGVNHNSTLGAIVGAALVGIAIVAAFMGSIALGQEVETVIKCTKMQDGICIEHSTFTVD